MRTNRKDNSYTVRVFNPAGDASLTMDGFADYTSAVIKCRATLDALLTLGLRHCEGRILHHLASNGPLPKVLKID